MIERWFLSFPGSDVIGKPHLKETRACRFMANPPNTHPVYIKRDIFFIFHHYGCCAQKQSHGIVVPNIHD